MDDKTKIITTNKLLLTSINKSHSHIHSHIHTNIHTIAAKVFQQSGTHLESGTTSVLIHRFIQIFEWTLGI